MTTNRMLERADAAFERLRAEGEDLTKLPEAMQTVVVIYSAQGVIDNGGFRFFFESDWPSQPAYALISAAYRRIGAEVAAACIDRAITLFPFSDPHLYAEKRCAFMEGIDESHELIALGDAVCGDATVWSKLAEYVDRNAQAF